MQGKTIKLEYPIKIKTSGGADVDLEEIKLCRPKTKHLKKLPIEAMSEGAHPKEMVPFIAALAGLSEDEIDEIDFQDLMNIVKEVGEILGKQESPQTSEKTSTG